MLTLHNNIATINIRGVLSMDGEWGDGTAYTAIAQAITHANNEGAQKIELHINSPGGDANGIDLVLGAVAHSAAPVETVVTGMCASAAYWLACKTRRISAIGPNVIVGSIGVYTSMLSLKKHLEDMGIEEWFVVSSQSPKKVAQTKEEFEQQQTPLIEGLFENFVADVAAGRKTSTENVIQNYGQGSVLLATEALAAGMIDAIYPTNTEEKGEENMSEDELTAVLLEDQERALSAIKNACDAMPELAAALKAYLDEQQQEPDPEDPAPDTPQGNNDTAANTVQSKQPKATISAMSDTGYSGPVKAQPQSHKQSFYHQHKERVQARLANARRS